VCRSKAALRDSSFVDAPGTRSTPESTPKSDQRRQLVTIELPYIFRIRRSGFSCYVSGKIPCLIRQFAFNAELRVDLDFKVGQRAI